ncbi:carboxymuconolactone decarboxylase family protein [Nocardia nova]|uniref:NAD(P)-binding domain-containing protein n=1 Tax=Nocardia nova TaxID=37330 RepID=UPI001C491D06|nr:NAD(P)-binding domain-containing protein [Nocardia nova]MBV7706915.1 carboxymuconolactone decarboxylase family protein [Nocardia nova]
MTHNEARAGVVGLGMIGGGVAVSLARRGRVPTVYDIRPKAADALPGVDAQLGSPADVAKASDVVMVAVVDADQARAVIAGPDGVLAGAQPGLTVVLLSTIALPVVHELAQLCAEHEVGFLDCGVTPGDKAAENGMVAILGGDDAIVSAAMPVLRDWAKKVVHCGPLGAGMATKIARNIVTYGSWRTVHEAAALAGAAGVDPAKLAEVIDTADPEGRTLLQLLRMRDAAGEIPEALGRKIEPLMSKDLAAAWDLAAELGVHIPLADVARTRVRDTLDLPLEQPERTPRERGLAVMDAVYGEGFSQNMPGDSTPFTDTTTEHLFGEVWARPGLSIRDRRLLVLGATAALGRPDLIRIQVGGALAARELTPAQLREAALQLAYYVGWGNATATHQGIEAALADFTQEKK